MKVAILGATRGMGRALARELAAGGHPVCVLGRDPEDLERTAADLRARGRSEIATAACDLAEPEGFAAALAAADAALGSIDTVIVTAGVFATQDILESDPAQLARLLTIDFTNTVVFCEEARRQLLARGGGTLCVFSSVAGDRARKPVVLYGAAKAGLSAYLEGLDHRFRGAGLRTICVKPGFVRTSMTAGLRPPPFAGEPEAVAKQVSRALVRGTPVVYTPSIWRWVMLIVRSLPRFVMRKIGF